MHDIISLSETNKAINHKNLNGKINLAYLKTDDFEKNKSNQDSKFTIDDETLKASKLETNTFKVLDGIIFFSC